jgi:hypothetical protein
MGAEDDISAAIGSLDKLTTHLFSCPISALSLNTVPPSKTSPMALNSPPQLMIIEKELAECIKELKVQKRIIGQPLTLEEMLNLVEEQKDGNSAYQFGSDENIAAQVKHKFAVKIGEVMQVDSDSSDKEDGDGKITAVEMVKRCRELETWCLQYGDMETSLALSRTCESFAST